MSTDLPPISAKVARIRAGDEPDLLLTTPSGNHAILNANQPADIAGCCVLLPDPVVASINDLDKAARARFLAELTILGDAILAVTSAERINYLILCNMAPELHGHCVPRYSHEDPALRRLGPFEAYDFASAPATDVAGRHRQLHARLQAELTARIRG